MSAEDTREPKAVRAIAGAADAAASSLREISERVVETVSDERFRADVRARFNELSSRVSSAVSDEKAREDVWQRVSELPADVRAMRDELPGRFRDLPAKAAEWPTRAKEAFTWERRHELLTVIPARVRDAASQAAEQATKAYDELAQRGDGVVAKWRGEYDRSLGERVVAIRERVADVADDVADAADRVADDLNQRGNEGHGPSDSVDDVGGTNAFGDEDITPRA
jgi:gas vesicle protein